MELKTLTSNICFNVSFRWEWEALRNNRSTREIKLFEQKKSIFYLGLEKYQKFCY